MVMISRGIGLAALIGLTGCVTDKGEKLPDAPTAKKTASSKSAGDPVPAPLAKLLPADQLNESNASAQAKIAYDQLLRERDQLDSAATASTRGRDRD